MGSSPRVRGSRWCCSRRDMFTGIIPAGAGLTTCPNCGKPMFRDHPRGCGAHTLSCVCTESKRGSSPRVRGSHAIMCLHGIEAGIIPAGAGLTAQICRVGRPAGDHPRGCGAHWIPLPASPPCRGSSPRVRGSQQIRHAGIPPGGIIPAGAGLTNENQVPCFPQRDHPRGCGAHSTCRLASFPSSGSSPRVRGSLNEDLGKWVLDGIIPAGAGLTSELFDATIIARDHPRGCGAHPRHHQGFCREQGSSPRVRGSLILRYLRTSSSGIIPAGAGLTVPFVTTVTHKGDHPRGCGAHHMAITEEQLKTDHPRGCGAHQLLAARPTRLGGSSPRVRGSRDDIL